MNRNFTDLFSDFPSARTFRLLL